MKLLLSLFVLLAGVALSGCGKHANYVIISDIRKAPELVKESHLEFTGTARIDLAGSYTWRGGSAGAGKTPGAKPEQSRFVIPIVPENWDPSQVVPLWVSFSNNRKDQRQEMRALQAALAAGRIRGQKVDYPERTAGALRGKSPWQNAVEAAEKRHGIRSDPRAPIVSWRPRA